jgi:tetratricopeptide (TPR) repeat protein
MTGYTTRDIEKLLGLPPRRVRDYARSGVVAPARGAGNRYLFGFRDLVLLRTARALLDADVPHRRVVRALRRLRAQLPADRSITEVRIVAEGDDVVVHDGAQSWDASSGQLRLAFDVADLAAKVEPLARRAVALVASPAEDTVDHWLDVGIGLELHAPDQARRAYQKVIELDPRHVEALANLGRIFYEQGATEAAIVQYRRALEAAGGNHPIAAFNLGLALEDVGRNRAATDAYQLAVLADPDFADAHYNLARVHERLGDRMSALRCLKSYRSLTRRQS